MVLSLGAILAASYGYFLWALGVICATVALISWAVIAPSSTLFGPLQNKIARPNTVALTFDDGPHPEITPMVLDILDTYGAKATFFVIGSQAERYPEILKSIHARGHAIGNHSYHHGIFTNLQSFSAYKADVKGCEELIFAMTGAKTQLFRPPMGLKNPILFRVVAAMGYRVVTWSCTFKATTKLRSGDIVLFHDGYYLFGKKKPHFQTPALLEKALIQINQKGWSTELMA